MQSRIKAFTLIELLVVVAIIGILAAVGVVSYSGYKSSVETKKMQLNVQAIYLAEQEYKSNNGQYYIHSRNCYTTSTCKNLVDELFDGVDDISGGPYMYSVGSYAPGIIIQAIGISGTKNGGCYYQIDQYKKSSWSNGCPK